MAMIQSIDGNALLDAFRAGRRDRMAYDEAGLQRRKGEAELAAEQQYQGLTDQLFRRGGAGGVAQQYGAGPPATVASQFGATGDAASSPTTLESPPMAPVETQIAGAGAPQPDRPPPFEYDPNILARMAVLKPQEAGGVARALKAMDDLQIQRLEARNTAMGATALYIMRNSKGPEDRAALLRGAVGYLREVGWTDEEIARADLSDAGLQRYVVQAQDVDTLVDNERAERNMEADNERADRNTDSMIETRENRFGETVRVNNERLGVSRRGQDIASEDRRRGQDVSSSDRRRPRATTRTTTRPAASAGGNDDLPLARTPAEAARLPKGTRFRTPDGRVKVVP